MIAANRPPLSRTVIADAALDLVEQHGFDHLTMRRLGQCLNVDAMSLYYHFDNKDDLLDAMLDRLFDDIVLPDPGSDGFADWLRGIWKTFEHPAALELYTQRVATSPAGPKGVLWSGVALMERGLSPTEAAEAYRLIASFVTGFAAMSRYMSDIAATAKADSAASDSEVQEFLERLMVADEAAAFEAGIKVFESALLAERRSTLSH